MGNVYVQKRGNVFQYQFQVASVNGKRKYKNKSGFSTRNEAFKEGVKAYTEYMNTGHAFTPNEISYSDYLDYWMKEHCEVNLKYHTIEAYKSIIRIHVKPKLLEDLSYTYFTLEKLNTKIKKQKMKKESSSEELDDFFEEMKNEFKEMVEEISKLLDNVKYNLDYPQVNGMMYCSIEIDNLLSGDDTDRIITLSNEKFHIEIESNNDKSIINIHKLL